MIELVMSTLYKNAPNKPRTTIGRGGLLFVVFLLLGIGVGFGQINVQFSQATSSDVEANGGNLPELIVSGGMLGTDTSVTVTDDGTGSADAGTDYSFSSPQVVVIPADDYSSTTIIPITGLSITEDSDVESDEDINFSLSTSDGTLTLGPQITTTYTINNDDGATVNILNTTNGSENGAGSVTDGVLTVTQTAISSTDTDVNYSITDGTATENIDFTATGTVTIFAGDTTADIVLSVIEDAIVEGNETVEVTLTGTSNGSITLDPSPANLTATNTILDDDSATLTMTNVSVSEDVAGGDLVFTVTLDNEVAGGTDVTYTFTDVTATGGVDYDNTGSALNFVGDPGETQEITVPITNDAIVEADETFEVVLGTPTNGVGVSGSPATGTITNDDSATLTITDVSATEDVAAGNMVFTVTLDNAVFGGTEVAYSFSDDTATGGVDYDDTVGPPLIFVGNPGETQEITVPITDDAIVEADETFEVALGTPTNGVGVSGSPASGTIQNDDTPVVSIIATDDTAAELGTEEGVFTVDIGAVNETGSPITINYVVSGDATPDDDYEALLGSVDVIDDQQTAVITVNPIDDNLTELDEEVIVTLDTGADYTIGSPNSATVTITSEDDNQPSGYTVTINQDPINITNEENVSFSFSSAPTFLTTFDYTFTSDGDGNTLSVTGSGTVLTSDRTVSNIDLSGLPDGVITLTVTITNVLGTEGPETTDIAIKDTAVPTGYSVTIDQNLIDSDNEDDVSFTFTNAISGTDYDYTFSSDGGGTDVTGSGTVSTANEQITGIDLSGLADGTITLDVTLSNDNGSGPLASDMATKLVAVPSGYGVTIDQDPINSVNDTNIGFTFSGAEVDADYEYTFSSSGGGTNVIGSGTISAANEQITGVNLSGLGNGTITLSVILSNTNGDGDVAEDTAIKETCYAGTTAPSLNDTGKEFCVETLDDFTQDLDNYVDEAAPIGTELVWSSNPDSSVAADYLASSVVTGTQVVNNNTYYGFYYDSLNNCASPNTVTVQLSVNEEPNPGTTTGASVCADSSNGGTTIDLDNQLSGADPGLWSITTDPSGGAITIDADNVVNFDGQPLGDYIFTYTATASGICADQTVELIVTVDDCSGPCNAGNTAPTFNGDDTTIEFCDEVSTDLSSYVTGTAPSGSELIWSTSSVPSETGAHLNSSNVVEPGTYYGFYYDETNDCGSPVLAITLVRNFTPTVDTTTGDSSCDAATLILTASASVADESTINYTWYDAPTGGNIVGTSATYTTNTLTETTSFYVSASANGCESERVEVIATIDNELSPGVPIEGLTVCNVSSDEGPTSFDLDDGLMGQDAGTWAVVTDPSNGEIVLDADNTVDFTGLPSGAYVFEYTTDTVGSCADTSSAQVTITVQDCISNEAIDLAITKTVQGNSSYLVGEEIVFVISVENVDGNTVTDIVISDVLDEDFEFIDAEASIGNYDANTGEWTIAQLEATDAEASLTITVRATNAGDISNTATLESSIPADNEITDNNSDSVTVTINRNQCEDPGTICTIFSPNSDGRNDTLTLVNHEDFEDNTFEVFDRYGNSVFQMDGYDSSWDGTGKNGDLPKGTYFYILDLNGDGTDVVKGWIQIVRNN